MRTPLRLLLVEDSPDDAELACLELERGGFDLDCRRVDSEPAFVEALNGAQWDAVISDYQMPEFNGLRAFEIFRNSGIDAPFIFVSGALGEERAVEAMRCGARDYILKGSLARLSVAVHRELNEAQNRRKKIEAEQSAQREQRCLAMAMEATGAGVCEFKIPLAAQTYITGRWAQILGISPHEVPSYDKIAHWFLGMIHPDDRERAMATFEDFAAKPGERCELELRVRHKSGQYIDVAAMARAIERDAAGQATRVVGVLLDLSERRKLEAQLRHSQKMEAVGRLAGGVAHDFNNLLTVILGYSDLLRGPGKPALPMPQAIEQIHRAAGRASELTRQLLAFSRSQIISPKALDLNNVVSDMSPMIRRLIGEDIDFQTSAATNLWIVSADPGQVEQAVMNLVVNARDAMPDGGKLTIETGNVELDEAYCRTQSEVHPGRYVMIAVTDNGIGMDAATMSRIFEPFFTTKEKGKGTGLGLVTVYGVMRQNRGNVAVYSELGRGTTFKIYWPEAAGRRAEKAAARPNDELPRGTETVLVVEDEDQVRQFATGVLSSLGYRVIEARDGVDALGKAVGANIQALVTDVVMPKLGGKDLALKLSAANPKLKVIYTSGYTADAIVHQGVLEKGVNFLAKPYSPRDLAQRLRATLDS